MSRRIVSLLTGDDRIPSGGHLYNQQMSERAADHGISMEKVRVDAGLDLGRIPGQILVDSLVAAEVADRLLAGESRPIAALVHQVAGGVDGSPADRQARRVSDLALYEACRLVIAASDRLGRELADAGVPEDRVRVVPPGRDLPDPGSESSALREDPRLAVLCVANWLPNKGILDLLDAVTPIAPDEIVLHLAGSPDVDEEHAREIRSRLTEDVVVHGFLSKTQLAGLYAACDVVVSTSLEEGYATVIGEALGSGVPVVAWASGNAPNLITDGVDGLLLPVGDIEGLTRALRRLAENRRALEALSAGAATRGATLPTWDESAALFFATLQELVTRV